MLAAVAVAVSIWQNDDVMRRERERRVADTTHSEPHAGARAAIAEVACKLVPCLYTASEAAT